MIKFSKGKKQPKRTVEESWPKNGDTYYWVRSDIGEICKSVWSDDVPYHQFRKATGNCFRTRGDAEIGKSRCIAHFHWTWGENE